MQNLKINFYNMDCMEYMANCKDKQFDLAIIDPPYGINMADNLGKKSNEKYANAKAHKSEFLIKNWDKETPSKKYFEELFRISKNQIIWGANYFVDKIINPSMGWIVWDKNNSSNDFSDCELAFTSFDRALRKFKYTWHGMLQENMKNKEQRIHPTQKPVGLYSWILQNYAKKGDSIFDSHLGSGSIALACHDLGFDLEACELDKDYFEAAKNRLEQHQRQLLLFRQEA